MGTAGSKSEMEALNVAPPGEGVTEDDAYVSTKKMVAKPIHQSVEKVFSFGEELGSGAFSIVYKGKKKDTGDVVAIKHISKKDCSSKDDLDALMEEVGILQAIHHPHVMRLYGFFEDSKYYSLVTEMVDGGELFERIVERKHYNEAIARDLVRIFLETLQFLHTNGIVHRDLKPENLLLASKDDDANIKLADFGFAKHVSEKLNTVCGTPDYIAPEICKLLDVKNKEDRPCYTTKVDIWSAGVIVYILLGGYPPFFDDSRPALFKKIKSGKFEFHRQYWKDTSAEAKDLISKMLTVNPKKRLSAAELLHHPWLHKDEEHLAGNNMKSTQAELKRFQARRKFKVAVDAVLATVRMNDMFAASHEGHHVGEATAVAPAAAPAVAPAS